MLPWSLSAKATYSRIHRVTGGSVRVLTDDDFPALLRILEQDTAGTVSAASSILRLQGKISPRNMQSALILGMDSAHSVRDLAAACWVGSNIIPLCANAQQGEMFGRALAVTRRRVASIYGRRDPVLGLLATTGWDNYRDLRPHQPLLQMDAPSSAVAALAGVYPSTVNELDEVERACAAMFTEELGFSPYQQAGAQYRQRIRELIDAGHSLIYRDPSTQRIVFKAEFGAVSPHVAQVQGVWVHPDYRGHRLSAPGMAAVVRYGLALAPSVSLYVNDYNTAALRTYHSVGFAEAGEFATVLF